LEPCEIIWTARAIKDLRQVYDFYTRQIGEEKAFAIAQDILDKVDVLSDGKFIKTGAIDEEFKHMKRQYKKLIEQNIKITYRLSASNPIVYINRVFDTRQDPTKK